MPPVANAGAATVYAYGAGANTTFAGGGSVDPGRTIAAYAWAVLSEPAGSNVTFADTGTKQSTLQNPQLVGVGASLVGDVVCSLVITDDLGATSETNWRKMPTSAFKIVAVTSRYGALRKLTKREKTWAALQAAWVDALDLVIGKIADVWVSQGVIKANTISEFTAANGVSVDGVALKDGSATMTPLTGQVKSNNYTSVGVTGNPGEISFYAYEGLDLEAAGATGSGEMNLTAKGDVNLWPDSAAAGTKHVRVRAGKLKVDDGGPEAASETTWSADFRASNTPYWVHKPASAPTDDVSNISSETRLGTHVQLPTPLANGDRIKWRATFEVLPNGGDQVQIRVKVGASTGTSGALCFYRGSETDSFSVDGETVVDTDASPDCVHTNHVSSPQSATASENRPKLDASVSLSDRYLFFTAQNAGAGWGASSHLKLRTLTVEVWRA